MNFLTLTRTFKARGPLSLKTSMFVFFKIFTIRAVDH